MELMPNLLHFLFCEAAPSIGRDEKMKRRQPFPTRARRPAPAAFSLVEMMAVVAIIAIMMAMIAPSISSFSSTAGRKGAVNILMNTLEQARAAALETGSHVYVVIRRSQFPERDAILVLREPDAESAKTTYEALSNWIKLPEGVLIHDAKIANIVSQNFPAGGFDETKSPVQVKSSETSKFNVLVFNPFGGVSFPVSSRELMLFVSEGVRGDNDTEALISKSKEQSGFEIISLRRFTGRASLEVSTL